MSSDPGSIHDFLKGFRETIESSASRLATISEEESRATKDPDKWSPKEIIGHLIDSAANNHQRFVRAQFSDELVYPGYEQVAWVEVQNYKDEPWDQLIQLWTLYNLHLAHVIAAIPEPILERSRALHNLDRIAWETVAKEEPATLDYFVRDYAAHLRHHLGQIFPADRC